MAKRGTTSKKGRVRILTRKAIPQARLCILIENGVPCANPIYARGICQKHTSYLRAHSRLEEYAHPVDANGRKHRFALKRNPEPGICRVTVNGKPCQLPGERRGLCVKHYQAIWQRPDLKLDDFCLPQVEGLNIRVRRKPADGVCRVREGGVDCAEPTHARGLCRNHYRLLKEKMMAVLMEKGGVRLVEELGESRRQIRSSAERKSIEGLQKYVAQRVGMLDYPGFRANGWDTGSGPTEASCKTLTIRLKGGGKKWDEPNAEAIMVLASIHDSGQRNPYWHTRRTA